MRILAVAEFDPAGVLAGHRRVLRAHGVDYRVAVHDAYRLLTPDLGVYDWIQGVPSQCDVEALADFAHNADVLQFHPAIGQPWSYTTLDFNPYADADDKPYGDIDWHDVRYAKAARVAYFHGSRNCAHQPTRYAALYRGRGMAIWTSTIDYACWLPALYAPPAMRLAGRAALRGQYEPLVVAHAPTDPAICHTDAYQTAAQAAGAVTVFKHLRPHAEVLQAKREAHAGFDHLRGCFSVNTLENSALGLVPLVGIAHEFRPRLHTELPNYPPWPELATLGDLQHELHRLVNDVGYTRQQQHAAYEWTQSAWSDAAIAERLVKAYTRL